MWFVVKLSMVGYKFFGKFFICRLVIVDRISIDLYKFLYYIIVLFKYLMCCDRFIFLFCCKFNLKINIILILDEFRFMNYV